MGQTEPSVPLGTWPEQRQSIPRGEAKACPASGAVHRHTGQTARANSSEACSVIPDGRIRITMVITGTKNHCIFAGKQVMAKANRMVQPRDWVQHFQLSTDLMQSTQAKCIHRTRTSAPHHWCLFASRSLGFVESNFDVAMVKEGGNIVRSTDGSSRSKPRSRSHPTPSQLGGFFLIDRTNQSGRQSIVAQGSLDFSAMVPHRKMQRARDRATPKWSICRAAKERMQMR